MIAAHKFLADTSVDFPAADISVFRLSQRSATLNLRLHFSRVNGGPKQDLEVIFGKPLALQWEDEAYGLIGLPKELPRCLSPQWQRWTFPMLTVEGSSWAETYAQRAFTAEQLAHNKVTHYAFVSLNDLAHVLSIVPPTLRWVEAVDA